MNKKSPTEESPFSVKNWPNYKDFATELGANQEVVRRAIHNWEIPGAKIPGRGLCVDRETYLKKLREGAARREPTGK